MDDAVRERVFHLVVLHTGVLRERLTPGTTLVRNLGMEGDVAAGFFAEFSKEFGVPLAPADWSGYFVVRRLGCGTALLVFVPAAILAWLLKTTVGAPFWMGAAIGILLTLLGLLVWSKNQPRRPEISIQDLIDCAMAREWKKEAAPR